MIIQHFGNELFSFINLPLMNPKRIHNNSMTGIHVNVTRGGVEKVMVVSFVPQSRFLLQQLCVQD